MTTHDISGHKDPRRAECGVLTDSFAVGNYTCKRCRRIRDAKNRRVRRDAASRLFAVVATLNIYGREGLDEEVRRLAVALHRGEAKPAAPAVIVERMFPRVA